VQASGAGQLEDDVVIHFGRLAIPFLFLQLTWLCVGQGTFYFDNLHPAAGIDAPIFDSQGNKLSGADYLVMLYTGPTMDSLQPVVRLSNLSVAIQPFFTGGGAGYMVPEIGVAQNVTPGTLAWVQMRAWAARLGATYEEARQLGLGAYGESSLFQVRAGVDSGVGPIPAPLVGLQSFSLRPQVPEPSALSLLVLSLPILWFANCHWRKFTQRNERKI